MHFITASHYTPCSSLKHRNIQSQTNKKSSDTQPDFSYVFHNHSPTHKNPPTSNKTTQTAHSPEHQFVYADHEFHCTRGSTQLHLYLGAFMKQLIKSQRSVSAHHVHADSCSCKVYKKVRIRHHKQQSVMRMAPQVVILEEACTFPLCDLEFQCSVLISIHLMSTLLFYLFIF